MKKRLPTPEERKLWRESNRFTAIKPGMDEAEEESEEALIETVAPAPRTKQPTPPPAVRSRPLAPLKSLPTREAKRAFKPYPVVATLDLHGLSKLEAHARVESFIRAQHRKGHRHVAIITGKGRTGEAGILRSNLPHWLNEPALRPLISAFATARPEKGGTGVTHVLLKLSR